MNMSSWGMYNIKGGQKTLLPLYLFFVNKSRCSDGAAGGLDDNCTPSKFSLDFSKNSQNNSSSASLASPTTPTSNAFIDITRGLTLTTVPGSPQKVSNLPKLSDYNNIPPIGDYFEVRVTMSANPSNFIVSYESKTKRKNINKYINVSFF